MARTFPDDPRPWQVLASSYLHRREWLTVRQDRVRTSTGVEIGEFWVTEFRPWVNVVAVTAADEVVLIRQYRHGLGAVHFELPAGTTDPGETSLLAAAERELVEETGYGRGRWRPLLALSANPALTNNLTHAFVAEGVERVADPRPDVGEDITVHLVPIAGVAALIDAGDMVQALNVAPLLRYLLERRDRRKDAR